MKLTVYHLKTCDTCRKAVKALSAAGHDLTLIDVRADGVSPESLERILSEVGREKVLNTRSATWRALDAADKTDITDAKALALITEHPTLLKRPVIDSGDRVTAGWTPAEQRLYL